MKIRYRKYLLFAIFLLIIGIFFLPFKIPFSFRATGVVYPIKTWRLKTDLNGNYEGELKNFKTGVVEEITGFKFERGDVANLSLLPHLQNNSFINKGDTLGFIYSKFIDEKVQYLQNLIDVEIKQLASLNTGEKESIVENLRQKMVFAEQQYELAEKNYFRALKLFQDSVIAAFEFDLAETEYKSARTNIDIANSEFQAALTGAKPEDIRLSEEKIASYRKEVAVYEQLKSEYILKAPFSGKVIFDLFAFEPTEYISISDTSDYILYVWVKFNYRPYLYKNMEVNFIVPGTEQQVSANVFEISNKVEMILNHQIVFTMAQINNPSELIFPGLTVQCKLMGDRISLWEYAKRSLNIFM